MIVKLDEKACSLDADELVAFVRLSFNTDKDGYVYGSNHNAFDQGFNRLLFPFLQKNLGSPH